MMFYVVHLQRETGIYIMCRLELIANKNTKFMCRPGYSRSAGGSIELNHHNCRYQVDNSIGANSSRDGTWQQILVMLGAYLLLPSASLLCKNRMYMLGGGDNKLYCTKWNGPNIQPRLFMQFMSWKTHSPKLVPFFAKFISLETLSLPKILFCHVKIICWVK